MINDWVQIVEPSKYAGAIGRIKTLIDHKDEENAYFKVFLQNNTIHIGIEDICSEDIRPIPLTPEILEKNGWMKVEADSVFYPKQLKGELPLIVYATDGDNWRFRIKDFCEIEYLHELQQAMRIMGCDKDIKL